MRSRDVEEIMDEMQDACLNAFDNPNSSGYIAEIDDEDVYAECWDEDEGGPLAVVKFGAFQRFHVMLEYQDGMIETIIRRAADDDESEPEDEYFVTEDDEHLLAFKKKWEKIDIDEYSGMLRKFLLGQIPASKREEEGWLE